MRHWASSRLKAILNREEASIGGTFVKNVLESNKIDNLYGDLVLMGQMNIRDLLDARLLIEPEAARAAALKATDTDVQYLSDCIQRCNTAPTEAEKIAEHIDFHNTIGQTQWKSIFCHLDTKFYEVHPALYADSGREKA